MPQAFTGVCCPQHSTHCQGTTEGFGSWVGRGELTAKKGREGLWCRPSKACSQAELLQERCHAPHRSSPLPSSEISRNYCLLIQEKKRLTHHRLPICRNISMWSSLADSKRSLKRGYPNQGLCAFKPGAQGSPHSWLVLEPGCLVPSFSGWK